MVKKIMKKGIVIILVLVSFINIYGQKKEGPLIEFEFEGTFLNDSVVIIINDSVTYTEILPLGWSTPIFWEDRIKNDSLINYTIKIYSTNAIFLESNNSKENRKLLIDSPYNKKPTIQFDGNIHHSTKRFLIWVTFLEPLKLDLTELNDRSIELFIKQVSQNDIVSTMKIEL